MEELEPLYSEISKLRYLNNKLQQDHVDLICQYAQFTTESVQRSLLLHDIESKLTACLGSDIPDEIKHALRQIVADITHLTGGDDGTRED